MPSTAAVSRPSEDWRCWRTGACSAKGVRQALGGDGGADGDGRGHRHRRRKLPHLRICPLVPQDVRAVRRRPSGNPYLIDEVLPQLLSVRAFRRHRPCQCDETRRVAGGIAGDGGAGEGRLSFRAACRGFPTWWTIALSSRWRRDWATKIGAGRCPRGCARRAPRARRFPLFGLEGTVSASLALDRVSLDERWVIARKTVQRFLRRSARCFCSCSRRWHGAWLRAL